MDDSISSLHEEEDRGINNLIISSVLLSMATTRSDIHKIVARTLLKVQENQLGIKVKEITDKALTKLLKYGILRVKQDKPQQAFSKLDDSIIFPSQVDDSLNDESVPTTEKKPKKFISLFNSTELELCPLGKAAMKGRIVT